MATDHPTESEPERRRRWPRSRVRLVVGGAATVAAAVMVALVAALAKPGPSHLTSTTASPPPHLDVAAEPTTARPSASAALGSAPPKPGTSTSKGSAAPRGGSPRGSTGPGGWPNAANTGVSRGAVLRASGDVVATKSGTVIDGLDVHGQISVEANNVTIRNTRVTNSEKANWGIVQRDNFSGLVVQDSQIRGNGSQEMQQGILNLGGDLTVRRTDISQTSDGIDTAQGLIEDCYLHDPKAFEGDHVDMIQATSGPPAGKSLTIRHNTIINTISQTSAVALFQDFGVAHDALVTNNYLAGGGYTVYGGDGAKGTSRNIRFENNTFGRDVFPNGGFWGPVAHFESNGPGNTWTGNVWEQTGELITPQ